MMITIKIIVNEETGEKQVVSVEENRFIPCELVEDVVKLISGVDLTPVTISKPSSSEQAVVTDIQVSTVDHPIKWTQEEDQTIKNCRTRDEAITAYLKTFGEKRTKSAIHTRWKRIKPNPKTPVITRGDKVVIKTKYSKKTGMVRKKDETGGDILVDLGIEGLLWVKSDDVELE